MKKRNLVILVMVLGLVFSPHAAEAKKRIHHTAHHPRHHHGAGVDASAAYSDIVIDAESGRIIHDTDADSLRHPASLTKMMTLYITFQALEAGKLSLTQYLPVSANASYQSPSKLGLRAGSHVKVQDLIMGIVTESANDAAMTLGEGLGGSSDAFAQMMTRQARALGMTHTVFQNPSGLPDPDQVTTAHDMAILGAALINHYPQFYPYFSRDAFTYAGIYHHNHNHLMDRYDGMDGIKTGYIRASGFNLVASVKRGNTRLIGVMFGGRSAVARDNRMAQLLDASFAEAKNAPRVSSEDGEGDSADNPRDNQDYVTLPAKVAMIFPPRDSDDDQPVPPPQPQVKPSPVAARLFAPSVQPAPAQAASNGNDWGIQIGAYSDASIGQQALAGLTSSMPDMLNGADPKVEKVSAGGVTMYRARLMALDKRTAQSVCSYLVQRGKSCLTVEP
ncbi:MAG: D-alanyl-D-alanine carboxypeptidase [Alphaproteobacteria bacterium]|nr:D-alanyl-D-alanine carboxypeptidase [Alphaproteobacteria bacterium]